MAVTYHTPSESEARYPVVKQITRAMAERLVAERLMPRRVITATGCWVSTSKPNIYGRLHAHGGTVYSHRVSYIATHGVLPDGLGVCHRCDNPPCWNPDHLFAGTHSENMQDRERKGRTSRHFLGRVGESHPGARLTQARAEEIRATPGSHRELAKRFGVSRATIGTIKRGTAYPSVAIPVDDRDTNEGRRIAARVRRYFQIQASPESKFGEREDSDLLLKDVLAFLEQEGATR